MSAIALLRISAAGVMKGHACLCLIKLYSDWAGFSISLKCIGDRCRWDGWNEEAIANQDQTS